MNITVPAVASTADDASGMIDADQAPPKDCVSVYQKYVSPLTSNYHQVTQMILTITSPDTCCSLIHAISKNNEILDLPLRLSQHKLHACLKT